MVLTINQREKLSGQAHTCHIWDLELNPQPIQCANKLLVKGMEISDWYSLMIFPNVPPNPRAHKSHKH